MTLRATLPVVGRSWRGSARCWAQSRRRRRGQLKHGILGGRSKSGEAPWGGGCPSGPATAMRLRLRFSKGPSSRLNSYVRQIRDSRRRGAPKAKLRLPRRSAVGPAGRSLVAHLRGTGRQSLRQRGCSNSNMLAAMLGQRAAEKPGQASRGPNVVVVVGLRHRRACVGGD